MVSFRSFRSFRSFHFGGFVSLFRVLVDALPKQVAVARIAPNRTRPYSKLLIENIPVSTHIVQDQQKFAVNQIL